MQLSSASLIELITEYGAYGCDLAGQFVEFDTNTGRKLGEVVKANQLSVWVKFNIAGQTKTIQRKWLRDNVEFVEMLDLDDIIEEEVDVDL